MLCVMQRDPRQIRSRADCRPRSTSLLFVLVAIVFSLLLFPFRLLSIYTGHQVYIAVRICPLGLFGSLYSLSCMVSLLIFNSSGPVISRP